MRSKRIESSCEESKASPSKPIAPVNLSGDKRTEVDSYDHELELEHGYSKGKQVRLQKKNWGNKTGFNVFMILISAESCL